MYEITAALSSVKTISDIATFLLKAKVGSDVAQKAIELQTTIISLQASMMSAQAQNQGLLEENNRLKQQLASLENWEAEATKYKLVQLVTDSFVYALNDDQSATQPYHWLCAHCFQNKQKSILQRSGKQLAKWLYTCPACKNTILGPVGLNQPAQDTSHNISHTE
jgi:hypothetical protein